MLTCFMLILASASRTDWADGPGTRFDNMLTCFILILASASRTYWANGPGSRFVIGTIAGKYKGTVVHYH